MKNTIYLIIIASFISSCGCNEDLTNNTYQIISLLYEEVIEDTKISPVFPPPLPSIYKKNKSQAFLDSINLSRVKYWDKLVLQKKKGVKNRKIIAINEHFKNSKISKHQNEFKDYLGSFKEDNLDKTAIRIDLSRIQTHRTDSIYYFNKNLLTPGVSEFRKFNILLSFSKIVFNVTNNKAVVVCSTNTTKLSGSSIMFFLKKTDNGRWVIVKDKLLSIS